MHVPEELAEYKLERAELAIALPKDWKLKQEDMKDDRWYWPIRPAEIPGPSAHCQRYLVGLGATPWTIRRPFAPDTELCAAILTGPQGTEGRQRILHPARRRGGQLLPGDPPLPGRAGSISWPTTRDALLDKMNGISFVVEPDRQDAITRGTLSK